MNKNMDFQVVEKVKHIQQRTGIGIISCINKLMGLQVTLICKTYATRIYIFELNAENNPPTASCIVYLLYKR